MDELSNKSVVCTLFEGHYHYGVAALTNSLYAAGYRGVIFAGYRGDLPPWTSKAIDNLALGKGGKTLMIRKDLQLHFIPLTTKYHLTNYKPDFMIRLLQGPAKGTSNIFYFDPDIVISAPWNYFDEWVECGVALCEDVNSPLPQYHPRRAAWRSYYELKGIVLSFKDSTYANGGYIGLCRRDEGFLQIWKMIQEEMAPAIGGLSRSALNGKSLQPKMKGPFSPFGKTDQDALNAAVEAWTGQVSFVGQEGMAIKPGVAVMPHALGRPKPWQWRPLLQAMGGRPPRIVDREYWKNALGIVRAHPSHVVHQKLIVLRIASLIGRFYKRR